MLLEETIYAHMCWNVSYHQEQKVVRNIVKYVYKICVNR